jgi:hypothetical protein
MRLQYHQKLFGRFRHSDRGSAVIMIFALITIVGALAVNNTTVLANLKRELQLVERRQLQHSGAIARTNQPASKRPQSIDPDKAAAKQLEK